MSKVRKFTSPKLRRLNSRKNAVSLIEDFIKRRGFSSSTELQQRTDETATWAIQLDHEQELEISLEGLGTSAETTLYMGINVASVPLNRVTEVLVAAMTVADTLIGAKLSLVNHDIVLSATTYASEMAPNEVDYLFELVQRQRESIREDLEKKLSGG